LSRRIYAARFWLSLWSRCAASLATTATRGSVNGGKVAATSAAHALRSRADSGCAELLVLDDLHWADPDSLGLLEFAARQLAPSRLLVVGGYRDDDAAGRLRRVAATAAVNRLEGLDIAGVGELMAHITGGRRATHFHPPEAAADATERLAFEDAVTLLERALSLADLAGLDGHTRLGLLLDVADARRLAGRLAPAAATYRDAFSVARQLGDYNAEARAAIGLHLAGVKTGPSAERDSHAALLAAAAEALGGTPTALAARVQAALARTLYHSLEADQMAQAVPVAEHAVEIARETGDPQATADALQALHDVAWRPGQANRRLDVLDHLAQQASARGAARVRLRTQLLRAQALLELGDPRALAEADAFCAGADRLGDPLSRWQSLSRRAATALFTGRLDDAADLASRAERLAEDLGDADAVWIGDIQRWELARFTGERVSYCLRRPGSAPPVETWPPWPALILAERGDLEGAATVLADFSARQAWGPGVTAGYDLWFPAIAAEAAARCGSDQLRGDLYQLLTPYSGTQVGCGAWVAYCGAVDYYLGLLAAAQGDRTAATGHLDAATAQRGAGTGRPGRVCAGAWRMGLRTAKVRRIAHAIEGLQRARPGRAKPAWRPSGEAKGLACGGTLALRWCTAGLLEADHQFRRVTGHLRLPKLGAALKDHFKNVSAASQNEEQQAE
jgi:tetratricopeptide (TPR) repeat protein